MPLEGKYYGTHIEVVDSDIGIYVDLTIWNNGNWEPSDRELDGQCTIEEWRENKMIKCDSDPVFYPDGLVEAKELIDICDSHFESRKTYDMAKEIVKRLNDEP